jgi:hypothetical protein
MIFILFSYISGTPGRWNTFQFPGVLINWSRDFSFHPCEWLNFYGHEDLLTVSVI